MQAATYRIGLVVLLSLASPAAAFFHARLPRHLPRAASLTRGKSASLTRRAAIVSNEQNGDNGNVFNATRAAFENTVRSVTGDEDYKFGDWTRGKVRELSGKELEEYQFGDITKKAVSTFTGKEEYEFGDLTRAALSKTDQALADVRDGYFNELPSALWSKVFGGMTNEQRRELAIAVCQLFAVALLSFGLVNALTLGVQTVGAWAYVCKTTGLSPFAPGQWGAFLETHALVRLVMDVPSLPVRALLALALVPRYRRVTLQLQRLLPGSEDSISARALALVAAWAGLNLAGVGGLTAVGVWLSSRLCGVPLARPALPVW